MGEGTTEAVVETEEMDVVVTTTIKEVDQNLYGRLGHPSAGGEGASKKPLIFHNSPPIFWQSLDAQFFDKTHSNA